MLINWTEPAMVSIPYPTVEALLCWWIVGMLFIAVGFAYECTAGDGLDGLEDNSMPVLISAIIICSPIILPWSLYAGLRK